MDVETQLDMVRDRTSGVDNYISQYVFEHNEKRHELREKRYFIVIVVLLSILILTNLAWAFLFHKQQEIEIKQVEYTVSATPETSVINNHSLLK